MFSFTLRTNTNALETASVCADEWRLTVSVCVLRNNPLTDAQLVSSGTIDWTAEARALEAEIEVRAFLHR